MSSEVPPARVKVELAGARTSSVPATIAYLDGEMTIPKPTDASTSSAGQDSSAAAPATLVASIENPETYEDNTAMTDNFASVPSPHVPAAIIKPEPTAEVTFPPVASNKNSDKAHEDVMEPEQVPKVSQENLFKGLRGIVDSGNLEKLEGGVLAAQTVLAMLQKPMQDFPTQAGDLNNWLASIVDLKAKSEKAGRTVIAVAGGTGAGKSSLINAVLNEERLLPTNGVRACTAVITEVSWNEVEDPLKAYRAEIEYVTSEEWLTELDVLYSDLVVADLRDPNSEASIAFSKVQSVYPHLTRDMIIAAKPKELAEVEAVTKVLGKTQEFAYSSAQALYSELSVLIDSKEKGYKGRATAMALWPLIRKVRIFVRADALSTGVVLVDLPGTADTNAARSAVASRYLAECIAVWVVAPITRAVDDKAASELLGRSSRIQMKLDGAYGHLTFIATQTDGIQVSEIIDTLDEDNRIRDCLAEEENLDAQIEQQTRVKHDQQQHIDMLTATCASLEDQETAWKALGTQLSNGHTVFAPAARRAPVQADNSNKRRRIGRRRAADADSDAGQSDQVPLTHAEISAKLVELNEALEAKGDEADAVEKQLEATEADTQLLQQQKTDCAVERARMCMQARNNYCRHAIQQDFASGIREIDNEDSSAINEDGSANIEEGSASVPIRDYEEVAESLAVFCISSKTYQQMRKKTRFETQVEGFTSIEDTEIPALQEHAKKSALVGQIRSNKAYLNQVSQVLSMLALWSGEAEQMFLQTGHTVMSEETKSYELKFLELKLEELDLSFKHNIFQTKEKLSNVISKALDDQSAKNHASKLLGTTVEKWGLSLKDGGYGMAFGTYRAICKRNGEKPPSKKGRNFNHDIQDPFLVKIASSWELAFTKSIPAALDKFAAETTKGIRDFHALIAAREDMQKDRQWSLRALAGQLETHENKIMAAVDLVKISLNSEQRVASRFFEPVIKAEMHKIYAECAVMKGKGCFTRMKETMKFNTQKRKNTIYTKAIKKVNKELEAGLQSAFDDLTDELRTIGNAMSFAYSVVLRDAEKVEAQAFVREQVWKVLESAGPIFDTIFAGVEPMDIDQPTEPAKAAAELAIAATEPAIAAIRAAIAHVAPGVIADESAITPRQAAVTTATPPALPSNPAINDA